MGPGGWVASGFRRGDGRADLKVGAYIWWRQEHEVGAGPIRRNAGLIEGGLAGRPKGRRLRNGKLDWGLGVGLGG